MITIPVQLSNELAQRVLPLQDRLPEIIELGLREIAAVGKAGGDYPPAKQQALDALISTGIITLPVPAAHRKARTRRTPIKAGGLPASALIIAERRGEL
jgi:hypothetical protein